MLDVHEWWDGHRQLSERARDLDSRSLLNSSQASDLWRFWVCDGEVDILWDAQWRSSDLRLGGCGCGKYAGADWDAVPMQVEQLLAWAARDAGATEYN